jgi:hypothetical protein
MSQEIVDAANANNPGAYSVGESFHFALNNMVVKDNRIPPRGFTNANFEAVQAAPVGYSYADGAFSDVTTYSVPEETYRIEVKLLYQTTSKEYIEFLRDNNVTDTKGQVLYDLWVANGKSSPVVMREIEFFTSSLGIANSELLANTIRVYPNPSTNRVYIQIENQNITNLKVDLYSLNGVKIRSVYSDKIQPNKQLIDFETTNLASGTYIIKFNINGKAISRLLVVK